MDTDGNTCDEGARTNWPTGVVEGGRLKLMVNHDSKGSGFLKKNFKVTTASPL